MPQFAVNPSGVDPYKNLKFRVRWDGRYVAGQLVTAYKVYRCWVSEFQALPELSANIGGVAVQSIKRENEGWERDDAVVEPEEPSR